MCFNPSYFINFPPFRTINCRNPNNFLSSNGWYWKVCPYNNLSKMYNILPTATFYSQIFSNEWCYIPPVLILLNIFPPKLSLLFLVLFIQQSLNVPFIMYCLNCLRGFFHSFSFLYFPSLLSVNISFCKMIYLDKGGRSTR